MSICRGESIAQIWKAGRSFKIFATTTTPIQSIINHYGQCEFVHFCCPQKRGAVGSHYHFTSFSFSCPPQRHHMMPQQRKAREGWSLCFLYPGHHFIPFGKQLQPLSNKPTHHLNSFYHRAFSITNPLMRPPLCSHSPWVALFKNCLSSK